MCGSYLVPIPCATQVCYLFYSDWMEGVCHVFDELVHGSLCFMIITELQYVIGARCPDGQVSACVLTCEMQNTHRLAS